MTRETTVIETKEKKEERKNKIHEILEDILLDTIYNKSTYYVSM